MVAEPGQTDTFLRKVRSARSRSLHHRGVLSINRSLICDHSSPCVKRRCAVCVERGFSIGGHPWLIAGQFVLIDIAMNWQGLLQAMPVDSG